ncbi:hypothetical protein [Spirillospora sp. CA-294931]|uniref:hypothetical protein n=1 Tax=Spirillospora sp. CA-294931 TaxID=3240042 RepID=UPI003D8FF8C4
MIRLATAPPSEWGAAAQREGGLALSKKFPAHPPRDKFAAELKQFHRRCGKPRYRAIVKMLAVLQKEQPELKMVENVTFSKSGISEVLNARRNGLPSSDWVASFVLCCQRLAVITGNMESDPGRDGLWSWQEALREAEDQAERMKQPIREPRAPEPVTDDTSAPAEPPCAERHRTSTASAPCRTAADDGDAGTGDETDADSVSGIHVSEAAYEHIVAFGEHAHRLLMNAMAGQPDSVYKVAILLSVDRAFNETVLSLVTASAATGHHLALELLQGSPRSLNRRLARTQAHRLARAADADGDHRAARTYYECALGTLPSRPASPGDTPS